MKTDFVPQAQPTAPNLQKDAPTGGQSGQGAGQTVAVVVGTAMPPSDLKTLPQLGAQQVQQTPGAAAQKASLTSIAHGMEFQGQGVLSGSCTVSGLVRGNLLQAAGANVHITLTETAELIGDVLASQIVVMGKTKGLLDAGGGSVTLHESSTVEGQVRYAKLQVNGANLNATLEKAAAPRASGVATQPGKAAG